MRVGLITTLGTNVGDELIRLGVENVLRQTMPGESFDFHAINKHDPLTVYPPGHVARWPRLLPAGRSTAASLTSKILSGHVKSSFHDCDLIVQCGAPVLWPDCRRNEWAQPLWYGILGRIHRDIPVLNLAAGTCYPWEHRPTSLQGSPDEAYVRDIAGFCRLTTVRDELAQELFASVGTGTILLPCAAYLAGSPDRRYERDGPVLLNYMRGGSHSAWGQHIDGDCWERSFVETVHRLERRHEVVFVCHGEAEYELARSLFPHASRVLPRRAEEYFDVVSTGKVALSNRLHMAVAMAGVGVPAVAVGTDTRMLMLAAVGLPSFYAKDVTADELEATVEDLLGRRSSEVERLLALRDNTMTSYVQAVRSALPHSARAL